MNKKTEVLTVAVSVILLFVMSSVIFLSANADPGDSSDPLVTKSYIDSVVASLVSENNSLSQRVEDLESQSGASQDPFDGERFASEVESRINEALGNIRNDYKTVYLTMGQTVILDEGAEFIIRTGFVNAVTPSASAGLYDLSDGTTVTDGTRIKTGHYIVAARSDRGFTTLSDTVILIRGDYTLE